MADLFQGVNPYSIEQGQIEHRRKMAEALKAQSMQQDPTQMVSGRAVPYSPMQGLSRLAQALSGARGMDLADQEQKALGGRRGEALAQALGGMPQPRQEEQQGPVQPGMAQPSMTVQPSMQDNAQWLGSLAQIGPDATQIGSSMLTLQNQNEQRGEDRAARTQDRILALEATSQNAQIALADRQAAREEAGRLRQDLQRQQQDFQRQQSEAQRAFQDQQRREGAADRRALGNAFPQPVTPVTIQDPNNPNATIVIDGRTRKPFGAGPKLTDTGKMENKRQFNMQGIGETIQEADDILSGVKRGEDGVTQGAPLPTGSGVGSLYDSAAGFFGASPAGSIEAQRLKAVGGALVAKMPRMEGPQSDKDVQLYRESAAEVGNPSTPVARRKAALETVKGLWAKYERLNPDAFQDRRQPSAPAGPKFLGFE